MMTLTELFFVILLLIIAAVVIGIFGAKSLTELGIVLIVAGLLLGWPIMVIGAVFVLVDPPSKRK